MTDAELAEVLAVKTEAVEAFRRSLDPVAIGARDHNDELFALLWRICEMEEEKEEAERGLTERGTDGDRKMRILVRMKKWPGTAPARRRD